MVNPLRSVDKAIKAYRSGLTGSEYGVGVGRYDKL